MPPKLNRKRARFVLTKIDEILTWEKQKDEERDTRFVDLGRYLCEVRAGQYWRLENLKSFDEFLQDVFPIRAAPLTTLCPSTNTCRPRSGGS